MFSLLSKHLGSYGEQKITLLVYLYSQHTGHPMCEFLHHALLAITTWSYHRPQWLKVQSHETAPTSDINYKY